MAARRICFIGDSITLGTGDESMLGWPGRLSATARSRGHDVTAYNLGVRGETSADIKKRWRNEAARRILPGMDGLLVFAFGLNDCVIEDRKKLRAMPEQTADNARALLSEASAWLPCLFVGPAPVDDSRLPPQVIPGKELRIFNSQIERANAVLAKVATEAGVPYLDLFTQLITDAEWQALMRQGDGVHPPQGGYELIARLIEGWAPWQRLFRGDLRA